jgi:sulfur carrier protein ThiS
MPDAPRGGLVRQLPAGSRVGDVLATFGFLANRHVIVGLDGQLARAEDPVRDGARIDLLPPISGGL